MLVEPCKKYRVQTRWKETVLISTPNSRATAASGIQSRVNCNLKDDLEKFQSKNWSSQAVHHISLRTDLGVFDDHFPSQVLPDYTFRPYSGTFVAHIWTMNCFLPAEICNKAVEPYNKTNPPFCKQPTSTIVARLLSL